MCALASIVGVGILLILMKTIAQGMTSHAHLVRDRENRSGRAV